MKRGPEERAADLRAAEIAAAVAVTAAETKAAEAAARAKAAGEAAIVIRPKITAIPCGSRANLAGKRLALRQLSIDVQ
jgi:hypothetical protein